MNSVQSQLSLLIAVFTKKSSGLSRAVEPVANASRRRYL